MKSQKARYLLICNTSDGLIAQLNGIVVQLQFARRLGLTPIIYLHGRSYLFGGPNPYFEAAFGPNVWDYYFEPVGVPAEDLPALIRDGQVVTLSTASELVRLYRWEPRSWFMNPYGYFRSVENTADGDYPADWWLAEREKARVFLDDGTMRLKASIAEPVDRFVAENFSEDMLGLQLRGSDKFDFGVGKNLSRKVLPEEYFPHIDRYLKDHPKCTKIFVATDQRQWLKVLQEAYPDKIVSFSQRSLGDGNENRFHDASEKAARGLEVLVDAVLLSRCSHIFKCHAAVGEMALTLNRNLSFLDLNYATQPFQAESRPGRAVFVPAIKLLSAIWRALSESGAMLSTVTSIDGDRILVDGGRALNTKEEASVKAPPPPLFSGRFVSAALERALQIMGDRCFAYEERNLRNP